MMRFKDKVVIVTGGSRGIGQAISLGFAREGASVVVASLNPEHGASVVGELKRIGRRGLHVPTDVSVAADCEQLVRSTVREFGKVDVVVTNAGIHLGATFVEETEETWHRLFRVNVMGTVLTLQAAVPQMMQQKSGRIVIISSKAAITGEPHHAAYSASKGAVLSLMRGLAVEMAPYNVTVNAVCPGPTFTDMTKNAFSNADAVQALEAITPMGRLGTPADHVGAVLFLASDEACWCTGQTLAVDGGSSIGNRP